jgi:NAD(P)H-hydrate repair Nnr-like enzyme with NAD(P)H-hydrate dehydratase domain
MSVVVRGLFGHLGPLQIAGVEEEVGSLLLAASGALLLGSVLVLMVSQGETMLVVETSVEGGRVRRLG